MAESLLADSRDRLLAETTYDRNVVVVAGAGTGKTTILVNRILNLLLREPHPLHMTEIVAVTFTNKAATEMKQRLRRELTRLAEEAEEPLLAAVRSRYDLTSAQVAGRAALALDELEKSQIGTLHSFAAHLLRLHPLEAAIDPSFQEDDGSRFKELFQSMWEAWLARELATEGTHHLQWRRVLGQTSLEDLRLLAELLAGESVDLRDVREQCRVAQLDETLRRWLTEMRDKVLRLAATRSGAKPLKTEKMLSSAERLFSLLLAGSGLADLSPEDRLWLNKDIGKPTAGWDEPAFAEAKTVLTVAQQLPAVDQAFFQDLMELLCPFLDEVRRSFAASGWLSFDGLLARAKALLRDHPLVRERMKQAYQAILVDEFQDTDPVQYEIILYLAERTGQSGNAWPELELQPGKLFIVGDPKQSIYAFRRADIEAFERVMRKIVSEGGVACSLRTNFRSDGSVLAVVNDMFDRLFEAEEHIQPSNERLVMKPQRKPELSAPGVQIRLVTARDDDEFDTAAATRAEAEAVARWMKEELLTGTTVVDRDRPSPLQPGHIALIFRKLTQAQDYLDALRRYDIAYLTDGEKHFYRRQEVIDFVNVLRVLDNPHDRIAAVGLLRSPLGGVADADLLSLQQLGGLDVTRPRALAHWSHPRAEVLRALYDRMAALRRLAPAVPVPDLLDLVFDRLPILELAAASLHGEQAVANLLKVRDIAEEVADRPRHTLTGFVDLMMTRLLDQPEEAESALTEASLDAVRILTIHKAKGLEFPVVVLPGLHQGAKTLRRGPRVDHDWSCRCYGLTIGAQRNLGSVLVSNKMAAREEAEQRRLLYVGMTRARDLLVLSGGPEQRTGRETAWSLVQQALGEGILAQDDATIELGTGRIARVVVPASIPVRQRRSRAVPSMAIPALADWATRYRSRQERWSLERRTPTRLTPSLLKAEAPVRASARSRSEDRAQAQLVGTCVHALLERWDFGRTLPPDPPELQALCRRFVPDDIEDLAELHRELAMILASFMKSDIYAELQGVEILGREIPFVMPWTDGQIMEGMIDLMYRLDGHVWIADYKTDRIKAGEARKRAQTYAQQALVYRTAAERCLETAIEGFQCVFLRPAVAVAI